MTSICHKLAGAALAASLVAACGDGSTDQIIDDILNSLPQFRSAATVEIEEAQTGGTVYTADATDGDGDALAFSITGGADADIFAIDQNAGTVTVAAGALDFENPADANTDNEYEVTVSVGDGSDSISLDVVIRILNTLESKVMRFAGASPDEPVEKLVPVGDFSGDGLFDIAIFGNRLISSSFLNDPTVTETNFTAASFPLDQELLRFVMADGSLYDRQISTVAFSAPDASDLLLNIISRTDDPRERFILFPYAPADFAALGGELNIDGISFEQGRILEQPVVSDGEFASETRFTFIEDINGDGLDDLYREFVADGTFVDNLLEDAANLQNETTTRISLLGFDLEDLIELPETFVSGYFMLDASGDIDGEGIGDILLATSDRKSSINDGGFSILFSTAVNTKSQVDLDVPREDGITVEGRFNTRGVVFLQDLHDDNVSDVLAIDGCCRPSFNTSEANAFFISGASMAADGDGFILYDGLTPARALKLTSLPSKTFDDFNGPQFQDAVELTDVTGDGIVDYALSLVVFDGPNDDASTISVLILDGARVRELIGSPSRVVINDSSFPNLVILEFPYDTISNEQDPTGSNPPQPRFFIEVDAIDDLDSDGLSELAVTNPFATDMDTLQTQRTVNDYSGELYFIPGHIIKAQFDAGGGTIIPKDLL